MPNPGTIVSFTNITDRDFTHSYGGVAYFVKAGETRMFPWDLADHLATHLARSIFIEGDTSPRTWDPKDQTAGAGKPLWSPDSMSVMKAKILGEMLNEEQERPLTPDEALQKRVEALEKTFGVHQSEGEDTAVSAKKYQDKAQVIQQLEKKGIKFDPRKSKADLEQLLKEEPKGEDTPTGVELQEKPTE